MPPTIDTDGALFEQLRPRLTAISRRIVGSEADAEDIVQDCFFKWHSADQAMLTTPVAWLTTIVQHQSVDRLRQRARASAAARTAQELTPDVASASPEHGLLRRADMGAALARLLASLSASERLALVLHEVFECAHADVAAALGTTTVNARQHLARASRRLRAAADDAAEPPASEKLCRDLIRRFQAALNGRDVPAMVSLLGDEQPMSVLASPRLRIDAGSCANDACYHLRVAA